MQSRLGERPLRFGRNAALEPDSEGKATRIRLLDFHSAPMRAFHLSWFAFFLSFVAWFGIAPLMAVVREDLKLTKAQVGNTVIASVAITIFARLLTGWLCDRFGPRRTYSALLVFGAMPVMGIGLSHSYHSFLFFRLAIGLVGASFVLTQYHTSIMFSRSVVGTANAVTAGWGNLGGGVTQWIMPLLFGAIIGLGADKFLSWRLAMIVPGALMLLTGLAYYRLTEDTPDGRPFVPRTGGQAFWEAAGDYRVWLLFLLYGACFGVEITVDNVAALIFQRLFSCDVETSWTSCQPHRDDEPVCPSVRRNRRRLGWEPMGLGWPFSPAGTDHFYRGFADGVVLAADDPRAGHLGVSAVWFACMHGVRRNLRRGSVDSPPGDRICFRHRRRWRKLWSSFGSPVIQVRKYFGGERVPYPRQRCGGDFALCMVITVRRRSCPCRPNRRDADSRPYGLISVRGCEPSG